MSGDKAILLFAIFAGGVIIGLVLANPAPKPEGIAEPYYMCPYSPTGGEIETAEDN